MQTFHFLSFYQSTLTLILCGLREWLMWYLFSIIKSDMNFFLFFFILKITRVAPNHWSTQTLYVKFIAPIPPPETNPKSAKSHRIVKPIHRSKSTLTSKSITGKAQCITCALLLQIISSAKLRSTRWVFPCPWWITPSISLLLLIPCDHAPW